MLSELTAALRALARARGYTVSVVLILALGLGSATGVFTMVEQAIFHPVTSLPDPEKLMRIEMRGPTGANFMNVSRLHFAAYSEAGLRSFTGLAGCIFDQANVFREGVIAPTTFLRVTINFHQVMGLRIHLGRGFSPGDEVASDPQPVIISERYWRTEFGGNPAVLGRQFRMGDKDCVVVGVLAESGPIPFFGTPPIYVPFGKSELTVNNSNAFFPTRVFARLSPDSTATTAESELRTLKPNYPVPVPKFYEGQSPAVVRFDAISTGPGTSKYHLKNWAMLGAVGLLYLISCVNAINLMLVRTLDRRSELGVRCALGGNRWQIVRPVLLEGVLLTIVSVIFGFVVGKWLFPLLLALTPAATAPWEPLAISSRGLLLLTGLATLVGLLLALVPLRQVSRLDLQVALKSGSQIGASVTGTAARNFFVVVQTCLAVALLICTGLMVRTCQKLLAVDPGFKPAGKLVVSVNSSFFAERKSPQAQREQDSRVRDAIAALPGIQDVCSLNGFVYANAGMMRRKLTAAGATPGEGELTVLISSVGNSFFSTIGVPLLLGRSFADIRPSDPPVAILSDSLAKLLFPGQNPLGKVVTLERGKPMEIIGVAGDVRRLRDPAPSLLYVPETQNQTAGSWQQLLVSIQGEPGPKFESEVRQAVLAIDPKLIVNSISKLERSVLNDSHNERSALINLQALGTLALALAAFGLFAMMNYGVAQRRTEFGVRFALGATNEDLQRLVLRQGLGLVTLGLVLGIALAWFLAHSFTVLLYETPPLDLLTNVVVAVLLLATALLACWLPVRRATRIDLARLLRAE